MNDHIIISRAVT